jgi:nucleoside-diphosphate-sugar epimerase
VLAALLALASAGYAAIAIYVATLDSVAPPAERPPEPVETLVIFGASGTAGDGILKAVLADPGVGDIRVVTRRRTPRIDEGVASGKVRAIMHTDYLDYAGIREAIAEADAVFWAIGLSSVGVDEETYRRIHVDFPVAFVTEWLAASERDSISFHYISSSDISEDASAMWARVKIEAENALFALADGTKLRVVAYRPDYIGPTREEAHLGQKALYGFFRPLGVAVRAVEIGNAMIEVSVRGEAYDNGDKIGTFGIVRLSNAYDIRTGPE